MYKCPICGRSDIELPGNVDLMHGEADDALTSVGLQTRVHCRDCGWSGPMAELKESY